MGIERRVRRHRKVKSSPGIIDGKRASFDSIEESPKRGDSFWPEIDQNLKKNIDSELQSEVINDGSIESEHSTESRQLYESMNGEEDETDDPIFSSINSSNSFLSSKLPSSSSNSSLSKRLPSSSDLSSHLPSPSSSYSSSTNKEISDSSLDKLYEDRKNDFLVQSKESENCFEDEELIVPTEHISHLARFKPLMQSPSIQVMDRSGGGYDPHRIPAVIFGTRSSTPVEWSVASTESLFSLHLGRSSSFVQDQILSMRERIMSGGDGENRLLTISTCDGTNDSWPSIVVEENEEKGVAGAEVDRIVAGMTNKDERKEIDQDIKDKNRNYISIASLKYHDAAAPSIPSVTVSNASIGSGDSSSSFVFPVLADGTKTIDPTHSSHKTKLEEQPLQSPQSPQPLQTPRAPILVKEAASHSWFNCFSCGLCCCSSGCPFRSCSYHPCSNCSCHISCCSSCFRFFSCSSCQKSSCSSCFLQCSSCQCHRCSCSSCFPHSCSSCHSCNCSSCFPSIWSSCHRCSCSSCFPCSCSSCLRCKCH